MPRPLSPALKTVVAGSRHVRDSLRRVRRADLPASFPALLEEEVALVHDYTVGSRWLNQALWSPDGPDPFESAYASALVAALGKLPPAPGRTYHFSDLTELDGGAFEDRVGEAFVWRGFLSTTWDVGLGGFSERAGLVVVSGSGGRDVSGLSFYGPRFGRPGQSEVVFRAGTPFEILGVDDIEGRPYVVLVETV